MEPVPIESGRRIRIQDGEVIVSIISLITDKKATNIASSNKAASQKLDQLPKKLLKHKDFEDLFRKGKSELVRQDKYRIDCQFSSDVNRGVIAYQIGNEVLAQVVLEKYPIILSQKCLVRPDTPMNDKEFGFEFK